MTHLRLPALSTSLFATVALLATPACFNPETAADTDPVGDTGGSASDSGTETIAPTSGPTTTTASSSGPTSPTTDATDPMDGSESDTTAGTDPSATTDNPTDPTTGDTETTATAAACDDGMADPGEFCPPDSAATVIADLGTNPTDLVLAHLQSEDRVDVVTISPTDGAISIVRSDGGGGFGIPVTTDVGQGGNNNAPGFLAAADLEPDGDIDIVAGTTGDVAWFLNNGGGQLQGEGAVQPGIFGPQGMGIANMDLDPAIDLVASEGYNTHVFLGRVPFNSPYTAGEPDGGSHGSVQATGGDGHLVVTEFGFDGDGFADVVVASSFGGGGVVAVRGNGDATFTGGLGNSIPMCGEAGCEPTDLAAGDLDDDGEIEILMSHSAGVSISFGVGDGTWGAATIIPARNSVDVDVVDLNNDGVLDVLIVSADEDDPCLHIALGNGDGTLAELVTMPLVGRPVAADVADFNDDGAPDIAVLASGGGKDSTGSVAIFLMAP